MIGETKEIGVKATLDDAISAGLKKIDDALLNTARVAKQSGAETSSALSGVEQTAKKEAATLSKDVVKAHEAAGKAAEGHSERLKKASGSALGFVSSMLGIASGATLVEGVSGAWEFLSESVSKAMEHANEAQQTQASLNASLQATGKTTGVTREMTDKLAESLSTVTTYSADNITSGEAMLAMYSNIGKNVFPQATKESLDLAAKLGISVPNAARLLGRALNDPIKGVSQLTRYGITLSAAQQDQIKSFMKTNDVAGAQGVILQALHGRLGDVATSMGSTLTGRMQIFRNQMELMQEKIGDAVIPILTKLLGAISPLIAWLADKLPQATAAATDWLSQRLAPAVDQVRQYFQQVGDFVQNKVAPAFQTLQQKLQPFLSTVGNIASHLFQLVGGLDAIKGVVATVGIGVLVGAFAILVPIVGSAIAGFVALDIAISPVALTIGAIAAAVVGVTLLFKHWYDTNTQFRAAVDALVKNTLAALQNAINVMRPYVTQLMQAFEDLAQTIWSKAQPIIANLVSFIAQHMPQIEAVITAVLNGIKTYWQFMWPWFSAFAMGIFDALKLSIGTIFNAIYTIIKVVTDLIQGNWRGAWTDIANFARAEWTLIQSTVGDFLGRIWAAIQHSLTMIGSFMHGAWDGVLSVARTVWNSITSAITGAVQGIFNKIGSIMNGLHAAAIGWATGLKDGLVSGITGAWNSVKNALSGIVGNIVSFVKNALGIHSPSTVFAEMGMNMMLGMIHGFKGGDLAGHIGGFINSSLGGIGNTIKGVVHKGLVSLSGLGSVGSALLNKLGLGSLIPNLMSLAGGALAHFNGSGNITQWIREALGLTGEPLSWLGPLSLIAQHESGGNPNAVNKWDINWREGHPSMGLMQTIMSTFMAHMLPGHGNIFNPVDNAASAIRYILARYGSVYNVPGVASMMRGGPYVGYATGGVINEPIAGIGLRSGTQYAFGERGSEAVIPLNGRSGGRGGQIVLETHNHIYLNGREMSQQLGAGMVERIRTVTQRKI